MRKSVTTAAHCSTFHRKNINEGLCLGTSNMLGSCSCLSYLCVWSNPHHKIHEKQTGCCLIDYKGTWWPIDRTQTQSLFGSSSARVQQDNVTQREQKRCQGSRTECVSAHAGTIVVIWLISHMGTMIHEVLLYLDSMHGHMLLADWVA